MADINLLTWNYKDTPDTFDKIIKYDYSYFDDLMYKNNIKYYVILITCNRIEIYFEGNIDNNYNALFLKYPESVQHLFYVSSGLESMSIGENDILRQIKDSLDLAKKRGNTDKFLYFTFQKALSIGKDVRTKTSLSRGKTSISTISLDILEKKYGIDNKKLLIIGTGKMAVSLLNYLKGSRVITTVAGRNKSNAESLAIKYGAFYSDLSDIESLIKNNDIIITVTSSKNYIIKNKDLNNINDNKILIDLSNPANIEKINKNNIEFYDLDSIYNISKITNEGRKNEIKKAEKIIDDELFLYKQKINEMKSDDIISIFYKFAENIKDEEIDELKRKVDLNDEQLKTINIMMNSFANKILAPYTNSVKTFIKNNEKYSYILQEYDKMLEKLLKTDKRIKIKQKN